MSLTPYLLEANRQQNVDNKFNNIAGDTKISNGLPFNMNPIVFGISAIIAVSVLIFVLVKVEKSIK
jgi:hypothetical protein